MACLTVWRVQFDTDCPRGARPAKPDQRSSNDPPPERRVGRRIPPAPQCVSVAKTRAIRNHSIARNHPAHGRARTAGRCHHRPTSRQELPPLCKQVLGAELAPHPPVPENIEEFTPAGCWLRIG